MGKQACLPILVLISFTSLATSGVPPEPTIDELREICKPVFKDATASIWWELTRATNPGQYSMNQMLYEPEHPVVAGRRSGATPPTRMVAKACEPLLDARAVIAFGGPAGVGKSSVTARVRQYGLFSLPGQRFFNCRSCNTKQTSESFSSWIHKYGHVGGHQLTRLADEIMQQPHFNPRLLEICKGKALDLKDEDCREFLQGMALLNQTLQVVLDYSESGYVVDYLTEYPWPLPERPPMLFNVLSLPNKITVTARWHERQNQARRSSKAENKKGFVKAVSGWFAHDNQPHDELYTYYSKVAFESDLVLTEPTELANRTCADFSIFQMCTGWQRAIFTPVAGQTQNTGGKEARRKSLLAFYCSRVQKPRTGVWKEFCPA